MQDTSPANKKPPPQTLGVSGIAEQPIVMPAPRRVNWAQVAALPPFQMFVAERDGPNQTGKNSHEWAVEVAQRLAAAVGDIPLLDAYCAWHSAKGYWPKESPMGGVEDGK